MALMRPAGESALEWAAGLAGLAPAPVVESFFGPIQARVLHVAVRQGPVSYTPLTLPTIHSA